MTGAPSSFNVLFTLTGLLRDMVPAFPLPVSVPHFSHIVYSSALKIDAACFSATPINIFQIT
jgi:hypothetical protein